MLKCLLFLISAGYLEILAECDVTIVLILLLLQVSQSFSIPVFLFVNVKRICNEYYYCNIIIALPERSLKMVL